MDAYLNDRGFRVLAALDEVASEAGATPAQVALAWLAAQPGVTAPIASATSRAQLDELLGVLTLELSGEQVERLTVAGA
jgi:aryl-alcohol dehydrogenase-like predicted oxidoreductase